MPPEGNDQVPQSSFPIIEVITAAITGGGLTKLADFFLSKESRQINAMKAVVDSLREQLDRSDERQEKVEERLAKAEASVAECQAKHHDCEHNVAALKAEIDRLMREHPPAEGY